MGMEIVFEELKRYDAQTRGNVRLLKIPDFNELYGNLSSDATSYLAAKFQALQQRRCSSSQESEEKLSLLYSQCSNLHRLLSSLRAEGRILDAELISYVERSKEIEEQIKFLKNEKHVDNNTARTTAIDKQKTTLDQAAGKIDTQIAALQNTKWSNIPRYSGIAGEMARLGFVGNSEAVNHPVAGHEYWVSHSSAQLGVAFNAYSWRDWLANGETARVRIGLENDNNKVDAAIGELEIRKNVDYVAALSSSEAMKAALADDILREEDTLNRLEEAKKRHDEQLQSISRNFVDRYIAIVSQYIDVAAILERQSRLLEAAARRHMLDVAPMIFECKDFFGLNDERILGDYGSTLIQLSCAIDALNAKAVDTWLRKDVYLSSNGDCFTSDWISLQGVSELCCLQAIGMLANRENLEMHVTFKSKEKEHCWDPQYSVTENDFELTFPILSSANMQELLLMTTTGGIVDTLFLPSSVKISSIFEIESVALIMKVRTYQ